MNISEFYYKNQAKKIDKLNKRMFKELEELKSELFNVKNVENIPIYLISKKLEYQTRSRIITLKYKKLINKEQSKSLKGTNKLFSFDNKMKEQSVQNEKS